MKWFARALGSALVLAIVSDAAPARCDTMTIDGITRTFIAQLPETKPAPLVIVLHGKTQTGADMVTRTSWPLVAKRDQFAVIFPDGLDHAWADDRPDTQRAGRGPPKRTDDAACIAKLTQQYVA